MTVASFSPLRISNALVLFLVLVLLARVGLPVTALQTGPFGCWHLIFVALLLHVPLEPTFCCSNRNNKPFREKELLNLKFCAGTVVSVFFITECSVLYLWAQYPLFLRKQFLPIGQIFKRSHPVFTHSCLADDLSLPGNARLDHTSVSVHNSLMRGASCSVAF